MEHFIHDLTSDHVFIPRAVNDTLPGNGHGLLE